MFFAAALAVLPFAAQVVSAASCERQYTVKAGDYCDTIGAAQNVSTYQIMTINPVNEGCTDLLPDQVICLGYTGEDCKDTYVVKTDDTCDGIANTAGVNSTILHANNPQLADDCKNLYVGEVLCTAKNVTVPPPKSSGSPVPTAIPSTAAPAQPTETDDDDDSNLPFCDEL